MKFGTILLAGCTMCASSLTAFAQEEITLRHGTFLPANVNGTVQGSQVFIDELARLTDENVKIEFYPAEQAGKSREALELVKVGAIDIYEIGTAYFSGSDVPLWGLLEAPNLVESTCDATRAMRAVGDPGGILWQTQYEPLGIRILSYYVYPQFSLSASRMKVTEVSDLKGMKLRNGGGLMERTVFELGGVPVGITGPETQQALQRGTIDSWMGSYPSVRDYGYYRYVDYGVAGFPMGTAGIFAAMSESKFQALPEDIQSALIEAGKKAEENFCAFMDVDQIKAIEDLQTEEYGMEIYTWTAEQVEELAQITSGVVDKWVDDLEGRGIPARDALEQYRAALPN
ncbi:TRAP transporter substrate-binding protein [Paracoccus sp. SCSIO 75233]|uniref:TRAP transporter substrate-binding protein n=1 Tax=Paracoccus sp. SCSIO 75233 TaxID=3017782 RepID=UPI0022F0DB0E|nr:TRAP transporter substrate-binding protein DctP [Paracoccus sp. SCSIO 75233]WBU52052.1 TRAP transporter substrate-binding protein DctP [Paracoccus sp. SCSIO 75233]